MKRILCLGDSITDAQRLFTLGNLGEGYVGVINDRLNSPEDTVEIINKGVDGFTVSRVLSNVYRDCIDLDPDIVTILVGINDIGIIMNTNSTSDRQEELLKMAVSAYKELIEKIHENISGKVIIMEPFIFPYPREYSHWVPWVHKLSEQIGDLAMEYNCPYLLLHNKLNKAAKKDGYSTITVDGIHLTRKGHEILADTLLPYIKGEMIPVT